MAITKIAGELLESNLIRTTDLAFNTNVLVVDVANGRIGIGTSSPGNFALDVTGDTRITGDLTVEGTTTTVDSQNLSIEDNMIVLNSSGSIGHNSGVMINRGGAGNNAVMYWDESVDKFRFGTTTSDGSTTDDFAGTLSKIQVGSPIADDDAATKKFVDDSIGVVSSSVSSLTGGEVTLGLPTDSSFGDGSYTLNNAGSVVDAIDDLNEVQENIRLSQYVKSVTFTADVTAAGSGATITLTISPIGGGADRYTITWGDSNTTTGTADSTPSHTYTATGAMSVTVKAYNNSAITDSSGSHASSTRTNYITIYTATPVVDFELYTASSGGSALTGSNLWVVEGQTRYMKNLTSNTSGATVGYDMNWGYGSDETIASGTVAGGVGGARLSHSWGAGTNTSTGSDTMTLELDVHSTANPGDIPATDTLTLKVYDDFPAAPNNLGSKTIAMNAVVGISPKLCSGFGENVVGSPTYTAGDSVNRVTTIDPVRTASQSTYAYNAASGTLEAFVNGVEDGSIVMSGSDNSGTATSLTIESESDFNLLNATGATTSFASSIYYPTHFSGFKAIVSKATSGISVGVNSFQIRSSSPSAVTTNVLEFVKEEVTSVPTISGAGTLTQGTAGTFQYISGVPYYSDSGSAPSLNLAGVTATILTGQCYSDVANPVEVDYDTRLEGSVGNAIANLDFTYANIDGASTMLSSGIPTVNVGVAGTYTLGTLTVPITTSGSAKTVNEIKIMARNCNGPGGYNTSSTTKIQVYNATTSGLDKEDGGIAVSDSLGATHDDDAVRIYNFASATTDNPAFVDSGAMNYYTDDVFTGTITDVVAGTREAICRFGTISHNTTNYSTGYLPAGPDLNTGRSGAQYYTFAFRRSNMANFNLTMSGRVSGMFIAAPGTAIDGFSGLGGWLTCSTVAIAGGVPGSNGGNGGDGCAVNSGDIVVDNTTYSAQEFTFTLGEENGSNARGNVILVRIKLESGDSVTALEID